MDAAMWAWQPVCACAHAQIIVALTLAPTERVAKYRHWLAVHVEGRTRLCLLCWSMKAIVVMHQETPGPQWWDS